MKRRYQQISIGFATLIIVLGALHYYDSFYCDPITSTEQKLTIQPGESFSQISHRLTIKGIIKSPIYWSLHVQITRQARQLKSGSYLITPDDTLYTLLKKIVTHDAILNRFTILEGWTSAQILQAMQQTPSLKIDSVDDKEIAKKLGLAEGQPLEGWLYPDTYRFSNGISNLKLFRQAYERMREKLQESWDLIAEDSPLKSPYEALILASIVEKEATLNAEKKRIAGIFILRMRKKMRLQSDPTTIYGLGKKFDGNLRKKDLKTDTPYNTYTRHGLPPTPIAMPDEHSLLAVVQPEITGDLYFVAKNDGSHFFSKTYAEHRAAVKQYQLR